MVEELRKGWPLLSWRTACLLGALLIVFMKEVEPPHQATTLSAVASSAQTALALSFVAPSSLQKTEGTTNHAPQPVKAIPKALQTKTKLSAEPRPHQPDEKPADTEQQKIDKKADSLMEELAQLATRQNQKHTGVHIDPVITEPIFASPPNPPKYPKLARKRGQEGIVLLEIWLDEWGKQSKLSVLESSGTNLLDQAAISAVSSWTFEPHTITGEGTSSRVRIPIEFALR